MHYIFFQGLDEEAEEIGDAVQQQQAVHDWTMATVSESAESTEQLRLYQQSIEQQLKQRKEKVRNIFLVYHVTQNYMSSFFLNSSWNIAAAVLYY